ncbi:MAG: pyruvate dehydrogenase (acetyl-transferring) E1 component subunit alpha [Armatimonadetes bacterium]|nr:pyruvate dehydrogenase (acetyl-transferring) E1 component subunit alpha [Armatimonadota bacterium]
MPPRDRDLLLHFYEDMLRIRFFEEKVLHVMLPRHLFRGSSHLYIGQEAVGVGAIHALRDDDYVISTHRGHGHALLKGLDPFVMFSEIMGRTTGCCQGFGGSMHLANRADNFIGEDPVIGSNAPIAAGVAWTLKLSGSDQVVANFFGDGALNSGAFHESANLAALWGLPVLFLCENNLYAISVPVAEASAVPDLENRACSYGLTGRRVNGQDVWAVYQAVQEAVAETRANAAPSFLVFDTYRFVGHHTSDKQTYRSREEPLEEFRQRDPVHLLERAMIDNHTVDIPTTIEVRLRVQQEIDDAFERALQAPWPQPEDALRHVYAEGRAGA